MKIVLQIKQLVIGLPTAVVLQKLHRSVRQLKKLKINTNIIINAITAPLAVSELELLLLEELPVPTSSVLKSVAFTI